MLKDTPEDKAVFAATDIRFRNKPKGKVTATPKPASATDLRAIITKKRGENNSQPRKMDPGSSSLPLPSGSQVLQVHNSSINISNSTIQITK